MNVFFSKAVPVFNESSHIFSLSHTNILFIIYEPWSGALAPNVTESIGIVSFKL